MLATAPRPPRDIKSLTSPLGVSVNISSRKPQKCQSRREQLTLLRQLASPRSGKAVPARHVRAGESEASTCFFPGLCNFSHRLLKHVITITIITIWLLKLQTNLSQYINMEEFSCFFPSSCFSCTHIKSETQSRSQQKC